MSTAANRFVAIGAFVLAAACASHGLAQRRRRSKSPTPAAPDKSADGGVARYCANVAPAAAEARIAWQTKRLTELEAQIKQRIAELDKKEAEARDWVTKRETLDEFGERRRGGDLRQNGAGSRRGAIGVDGRSDGRRHPRKLSAHAASAILNEMEAAKAGKLTGVMSGAAAAEKKS